MVRCGRCQTGFDVPGPGRYTCPTCGTQNQVGAGAVTPPAATPEPVQPAVPSPRVTCGECGFSFIVGAVDAAPCPNCGGSVTVQNPEDEDE